MEMNFNENLIKMPKSMVCIEVWDGDPILIKKLSFSILFSVACERLMDLSEAFGLI